MNFIFILKNILLPYLPFIMAIFFALFSIILSIAMFYHCCCNKTKKINEGTPLKIFLFCMNKKYNNNANSLYPNTWSRISEFSLYTSSNNLIENDEYVNDLLKLYYSNGEKNYDTSFIKELIEKSSDEDDDYKDNDYLNNEHLNNQDNDCQDDSIV